MAVSVLVRRRGTTTRERHPTLDAAFDAVAAEVREAMRTERRPAARALAREYAPSAQVAVRVELRGPGRVRAGVDVRGDGTAEAYTGRVVRRVVEARRGEDAVQALRRALGADG